VTAALAATCTEGPYFHQPARAGLVPSGQRSPSSVFENRLINQR